MCFILGISFFLNAYDGQWALTETDRGQTYVYLDIVIGVAFWIASYILLRVWQARQDAALYAAYLRESLGEDEVTVPEWRRCPGCGETARGAATRCPNCGHRFDDSDG